MRNKTNNTIYWAAFEHGDCRIHIAATADGICFVGSENQSFNELVTWSNSRFPGSVLVQDDNRLLPYSIELLEYLQGTRKSFTIPFDYYGTPFQMDVWNALCSIPYGQTYCYSDIANQIQKPAAVRAVGTAIGANPLLIVVPCHRVIGKNGALTGYRGGIAMKKKLLQLEQAE
ncbi:methylated-DNA-[protein]-cysteine S-methyltransferase [Paenibacillus castaneae]|uniref:methylated-DNA--[protein]-cysteine S-methyltransferase n=1 Tax=Paenibacillus castaneae TaxID=474957 RepID=UPI000C9CDF44|nr:methylated-DNA--[protein]-cysteine S-methyltransferase [Paenibacillus castaneae]NIK76781.1 methylated-DNA-[protein]-cysteine S-methyltransferase [Paenibacillus castaneae]